MCIYIYIERDVCVCITYIYIYIHTYTHIHTYTTYRLMSLTWSSKYDICSRRLLRLRILSISPRARAHVFHYSPKRAPKKGPFVKSLKGHIYVT